MTLNKVNGCNDVSFGDHSVLEGDRIPPLKLLLLLLFFFYPRYLCSRGSLKNWKYKIQVGTTINLCDQRPADSRAAKWR